MAAHDFVLPYAFIVLIFAHTGGALKHHFLDGSASIIRRMLA
jgi:cytochrome b561